MKKRKLNYIKFLSVILVLLIIVIFLINNTKKEYYNEKLKYINSEEWNNEEYPKGMSDFVAKYNGEIMVQNMGKSLYYVASEFFPKINLNLQGANEKEIIRYYNNNQKEILMILGNINKEEFISLVKEITKLQELDAKFEKYYLDIESIQEQKSAVIGDLYIKYQNSDEIKIKIEVIEYFKDKISPVKYYN